MELNEWDMDRPRHNRFHDPFTTAAQAEMMTAREFWPEWGSKRVEAHANHDSYMDFADALAAERCRGLEQINEGILSQLHLLMDDFEAANTRIAALEWERDEANKLLTKFKRCFESALESIWQYETK